MGLFGPFMFKAKNGKKILAALEGEPQCKIVLLFEKALRCSPEPAKRLYSYRKSKNTYANAEERPAWIFKWFVR